MLGSPIFGNSHLSFGVKEYSFLRTLKDIAIWEVGHLTITMSSQDPPFKDP